MLRELSGHWRLDGKTGFLLALQKVVKPLRSIFSLIQTCRALNINPREYLEDVMKRLMDHPANKIHELLPDQWAIGRGINLPIQK